MSETRHQAKQARVKLPLSQRERRMVARGSLGAGTNAFSAFGAGNPIANSVSAHLEENTAVAHGAPAPTAVLGIVIK